MLPGLPPSVESGLPEATIHLCPAAPWQGANPPPVAELISRVRFADGALVRSLERVTAGTQVWLVLRFQWDLVLAFTEDGRAVYVFGALAEDLSYVASFAMGPLVSFLRWLRGWPSLHASAVEIGGRVLALAGPSGAGKSTTTAALALAGHPQFTDDLLGWRSTEEWLLACPGPVGVKLCPDSLAAMGFNPEHLPTVQTNLNKRRLQLPVAAHHTELPLGAVYLLSQGMEAPPGAIRELHGLAAFTALKANCRDDSVLTPVMRQRQFEALAELARRIPVLQVKAHAGLDRLPELAATLAEDFRRRQVA
ncbi:MAG: hypothetical protein EBS05_10995 [Proteobacteria bacterium]|nr:hypothetical protein [Pseudomonadota bacterium]